MWKTTPSFKRPRGRIEDNIKMGLKKKDMRVLTA